MGIHVCILGEAPNAVRVQERRQLTEHTQQCKMTDLVQFSAHFYGLALTLQNVKYTRPRTVYITEEAFSRVVGIVDPVAVATERLAEVREANTGEVECRREFFPERLYSKCPSCCCCFVLVF